jgi:hypothetical protein
MREGLCFELHRVGVFLVFRFSSSLPSYFLAAGGWVQEISFSLEHQPKRFLQLGPMLFFFFF